MTEKQTAFYLMGHGPRREPRFIDLQYRRIVRYRRVLRHDRDAVCRDPKIFVDLNEGRRFCDESLDLYFPQLAALLLAIKDQAIGLVYLDLCVVEPWGAGYSWIPHFLVRAGAEVVNTFYGEDLEFVEALRSCYGSSASYGEATDASDIVCFFPRAASAIAMEALEGGRATSHQTPTSVESLFHCLQCLSEENPYASGRSPRFSYRLLERWYEKEKILMEAQRVERRRNETLYRIAPGGVGLLLDEELSRGKVRDEVRLAWAEDRVLNDLGFRREGDAVVSYVRQDDELWVYADMVAAASALRRSEIRGLKWKDVDTDGLWFRLERGYVRTFQTDLKTEASKRGLPMHPELAILLKAWRTKTPYPMEDDWVFASPYTEGQRPYWPESAMVDYVRPAAQAAGITKTVNWHAFRHSLGTLMKTNGEDVKTIQELLRHANSRITLDVYTQGDTAAKRSALAGVSGIFLLKKSA